MHRPGVLADVSGKLVDQFATCLAAEINVGTPEPVFASVAADLGVPDDLQPPAVTGSSPGGGSAPAEPRRPAEAIDLLETAGAPVLKRLVPLLVALAALVYLVRKLRG